MTKVNIVFDNGKLMAEGYGHSKKQAEKNASLNGLKWLKENKQTEIE